MKRVSHSPFSVFLLVMMMSMMAQTSGSEVKLAITPVTITNGLTESLKLRCSLQDTTNASGVVARRQVFSTPYHMQHVSSIIISRVNPDKTVTSLAEIITSEKANVLDDFQTLTVVGTLTPSDPADPEYLELTWTNPGEEQSGSYTCEVNGLDPHGHGVMLQKNMAVKSDDPEVKDLVKVFNNLKASLQDLANENKDLKATVCGHTSQIQDLAKENNDLKATVNGHTSQIQDLAKENNGLKATVDGHTSQIQILTQGNNDLKATVDGHTSQIQDLAKENNALKATVDGHTSQIQDLAKENNGLKATIDGHTSQIQDLAKENNDLKATVDGHTSQIQDLAKENNELKVIVATHKAPHTEGGEVKCGDSNSWPRVSETTTTRQHLVPVTFKRPYSSLPVIMIADVKGDFLMSSAESFGHHWFIDNVTTTGFNIGCAVWSGTHYASKNIRWTSIVA